MTRHTRSIRRGAWAGLAVGPGAWGVSTQVNYALAPYTCVQHRIGVAVVALALTLISFAAAFWSWRSLGLGGIQDELQDTRGGHPERMLAFLGLLAGGLFGLTIAVQATAGLILNGCLR